MIEFGKTLRQAREAKGYTIAQLASTTHLLHTTIEELESEDFSRIPAPIYGRGFVKLYCEAVGLDPRPLVAEFMEILNGNRIVEIKERPLTPPPPEPMPQPAVPASEPAPTPAPEPTAAPSPAPSPEPAPESVPPPIAASAIPAEALPTPPPIAEPIPSAPPPRAAFQDDFFTAAPPPPPRPTPAPAPSAGEFPFPELSAAETVAGSAAEPAVKPSLSRYAAPIREVKVQSIPPAFWRMALLVSAILALVVLVVFGLRSLHSALTTEAPAAEECECEAPAAPTAQPPAETGSAQSPARPRTPQKIPSLYID